MEPIIIDIDITHAHQLAYADVIHDTNTSRHLTQNKVHKYILIIMACAFALIGGVMALQDDVLMMIAFLAVSGAMLFRAFRLYKRSQKRSRKDMENLLKSEFGPRFLGARHIEFRDEVFIIQSPLTRTEFKWEAITYIHEDADYFVLVMGLHGHIIPKSGLDMDAKERITQKLTLERKKLPGAGIAAALS